ncbi:MAG: hypothetical protein JST46_18025 [Bacteroidetes bacterium]|nr:hypothetical protein [Bacteroidota bacterium]
MKIQLFGLTLVLMTAVFTDSFSCMCNKVKSRKMYKDSDYVIIGRALKNLRLDSMVGKLLDLKGGGGNVSFQIQKVLKGTIDKEIVAIIQDGSSCTMWFKFGDSYLIFGKKREHMYDSMDVYSPILQFDSTDTITDEEIIQIRKTEFAIERQFEDSIKAEYGLMINTDMCLCFYEQGKTFKKYMRRKRTADNKMYKP